MQVLSHPKTFSRRVLPMKGAGGVEARAIAWCSRMPSQVEAMISRAILRCVTTVHALAGQADHEGRAIDGVVDLDLVAPSGCRRPNGRS